MRNHATSLEAQAPASLRCSRCDKPVVVPIPSGCAGGFLFCSEKCLEEWAQSVDDFFDYQPAD
jgi:hypothetical protein